MVARIHYRWDFIGLSTDTKPTPETSEKVVDGSTYYCSDNSKLYVWYKTQWYERKPLGGGGGGGSYTAGNGIDITDDTISVDTTTIQPKLTAGNNITITDDTISATDTTYTAGSNITITNGEISATDTTYSAFTGTDGTAAGTSGLVPAPATTDAGKFLKADGSWATVSGGGGITELTSADYNWPTSNPDGVAMWLLPDGVYEDKTPNGILYPDNNASKDFFRLFIKYSNSTNSVMIYYDESDHVWKYWQAITSTGARNGLGRLSPNVVQTTGNSTTAVMSQNAVTSMVFADPATKSKIRIGGITPTSEGNGSITIRTEGNGATSAGAIAIGNNTQARSNFAVVLGSGVDTGENNIGAVCVGYYSGAIAPYSVAMGAGSKASVQGEFSIGDSTRTNLYNGTGYRLLTNVYDPQSDHDAATKGYVDGKVLSGAGAPTTSTVGTVGQLYEDSTNGDLYICTAIVPGTDPDPDTYTWVEVGAGGSGPTVVQTTGTSTTDVMSQNAVTSMVFADPSTMYKIKIGAGTSSSEGNNAVEIGHNAAGTGLQSIALGYGASASQSSAIGIGGSAQAATQHGIAIGYQASTGGKYCVALGSYSVTPTGINGVVSIGGANLQQEGYNSSNYRLLTGLYDGQSAHDAATVGQITPTTDSSAPTSATAGRLGEIRIDTTDNSAYMCVVSDSVTPTYTWKKITA